MSWLVDREWRALDDCRAVCWSSSLGLLVGSGERGSGREYELEGVGGADWQFFLKDVGRCLRLSPVVNSDIGRRCVGRPHRPRRLHVPFDGAGMLPGRRGELEYFLLYFQQRHGSGWMVLAEGVLTCW